MTDHLFKTGTIVSLDSSESHSAAKSGSFIVEAQMPPVGTSLQYRIKSESEGFSRVVVEHQLSLFGSTPNLAPPSAAKSQGGEED